MSTQAHNKAISDLLPDTIIELYEVELGGRDGIKRFHAGKLIEKDIILSEVIDTQGGQTIKVPHTYFAIPFEVDGFESRGDGQLPRPKLTVANPKGVITDLIKRRDDLVGSLFKRIRIFLKYIDEENFPDGINPFATSDPSSRFDDDIYVFNRKVTENKYLIEFELVSPLEMENAKLPARIMIANYCPWHYRGLGCRYGQRALMEGPVVLSKAGSRYFLDKKATDSRSYATGTATQSGTTVTGLGTTWEAWMVGMTFNFTGGTASAGVITGFTSAAKMTVTISQTVTAETYQAEGVARDSNTLEGNLGITVADENDKEFVGAGGYDTGRLNWAYDYDHSGFTTVITGSSATDEATSIDVGTTVTIDNVGGYAISDEIQEIALDPTTSRIIYEGQTITFTGGGKLEVSTTASSGADSIFGILSYDSVVNDEVGSVGITAEISRGRTVKFSDGSLIALSATAVKDATSLASTTVNYGGAIGIVKYGSLRTPTTGGTLATGVVGTLGYVVGDMVRVKPDMPTAFTKPESSTVNPGISLDRFFVCIKDHYAAQDPRYKSEYWREDQCGKTLVSCRLRYEEFAEGLDGHGLPFGGFPSIEAYRYSN
jgi:lambda family phage minor tail protein L